MKAGNHCELQAVTSTTLLQSTVAGSFLNQGFVLIRMCCAYFLCTSVTTSSGNVASGEDDRVALSGLEELKIRK